MPREYIYDHSPNGFNVEVTWGRFSDDVQIATIVPEPEGNPEVTGEPYTLKQLVESWSDIEGECSRGLYSTLNRASINQLIRVLRRARDSAFGRDE